jgi:hypothetical protein
LQKKNADLSFRDALTLYFSKETAAFAFGFVMFCAALFMLPDFINMDITKEDLRNMEAAKWKTILINFLRGVSVLFGYLCQNLGYYLFGRSDKILEKRSQDEGIDLPNR